MSEVSRIEMLQQFLTEHPNDSFTRYALAMEHSRAGQVDTAMAEFNKLLAKNPDYDAGYFMAAQTLHKAGRVDEAKSYLEKGIASATRNSNSHARTEMEAMLDELNLAS